MLLQNKWRRLLKLFEINENIINQTFSEIATLYECQGRYYHNLKHIKEVLEIIDNLYSKYKLDASLEFAAWFHDIVYDTQAHNNEEKSAEYARNLLSLLNIPSSTVDKTCRLILTTKHHKASEDDLESQILLDADLAILGSDPQRYREYILGIRQEYAWVKENEYNTKRSQVLQKFLQRARIFSTSELYQQLELIARNNIKTEIIALELPGGMNS
ncbi:MAG: HD domain-containing protein [Calothrix sp. FI2-JRJ7]|jgi:predicted metal-dependent HD superfamily phosphohydrolase|nr:HD domain-containing protein [Calothrix sp. FI2-JRJ7]